MKTRFNKIFSILAVFFFCLTTFTAGAYDLKADLTIYFDVTEFGNFSGKKLQIMIGHGSYSKAYEMKNVAGFDKIYSVNIGQVNSGGAWGGATQLGFMATSSVWGEEDNSPQNRLPWADVKTQAYNISKDLSGNVLFKIKNTSDKTIDITENAVSYYITGIVGNNKIKMTYDANTKQYVLNKQTVKSTDVIKVRQEIDSYNTEYKTLEAGSCATSSNSGITMQDGIYDFYFKLSNDKLYVGVNESNPTKYFIMGIDGDWDNGIEIKDKNLNNANEVMLTCLNVTSDAQIKIKEKKLCQEVWKNAVKDGSVVDKPSNDDNIELPEGVYSFYYNTKDHNLFIGNATPTKAYITGIAGDEKIEMDFDKTKNEFVLQNQQVQSTDKVKVRLEWSCGATAEYAALDEESCATATSTDNVITMNGGYYYDFYFKLDTKKLYVGANTTNPANADKYYLVGIGGDWDNGIELEPEGEDKMVKLGQEISKTDQVKIEKRTPCGDVLYDGIKVESPVPYYRGENNNIVLEDGTYNFYFYKNENTNQIYISGTIDNANVVYLDPKVENENHEDWGTHNARFAVYYYKSGTAPVQAGWVSAKKDDNGRYYAQFPAAYDTYIWCRMDPNNQTNGWGSEKWNQTDNITFDADKPLTKLTTFGDGYAKSYQMINCTFPPIEEDFPVMVRINQFVESDPCNYLFKSFEEAWEVLKQNKALCTVDGDAVTLKHPVEMLVTNGDKAYKGATDVEHTGGHVPTKVIMFKDINPNVGEPLVITTADPRGNRAVLVHPVVRNCRNITFDRLDIVGDKDTKDNAMDIGVDMSGTVHSMENMALIPRPDNAEPSNITIQNCKVESWGRNALHVVGAKGLHIENNDFFTHYDYTGSDEDNKWTVDWAGTIKFVNSTDIKFLRNTSEGTLATSLFLQGCKRILVMNNVFWNDNAVDFAGLAEEGRTVASVRLVTYNNNALKIENIGIYYNTFYIKNNDVGDRKYDNFDFFRLGGLMQEIDTEGERNAFNPEKIRFQYNNCYSYDDDIVGNNKDVDNQVKFYLQSFGHDTNWCQSFKYNNFWSEYDKDQEEKDPNHVSSNFEVGIFCTGDNETYNAYIDMRGQVCATDPANPGALVVKGSGLNIGTVIIDDVSGLGADKIFTDRLNGNAENPIRPTTVVDNSNESLSPSDNIYKEPGTIHFYTSPIVGSQTTDVHVSSVALATKSKVYLSIVDGDVQYFRITDDKGGSLPTDGTGTYLQTDNNGSLDNAPLFVTFLRPNGQTEDATFSAFLQIQPASDESLKLLIPLKGHNTVKVKDIKGAWTVGAFQQRESKPVKTIIWSGSESTEWDNRNNWYKEDGTVVTCLDVLDKDLTVIIPSKESTKYKQPEGDYPTLPAISNEDEFKTARTNKWYGEQVNAGSNASASTTKVANKIYLEYGAALVGVEQLNINGGVERYTEVEQEFVARRHNWLLVGPVVKPWGEDGKPRNVLSGDYFLNDLPHVYMRRAEATIKEDEIVSSWNESFPELDSTLTHEKAFAVRLPNEYGRNVTIFGVKTSKITAKQYNKHILGGENVYDPDEPHTYTFTGRFYNEASLPTYTVPDNHEPGTPLILNNSYPANINAQKLKEGLGREIQYYNYEDKKFVALGNEEKAIMAQHSFIITPKAGEKIIKLDRDWFETTETGHRSAFDETESFRVELRNNAKSSASDVYISYDQLKEDEMNSFDAPKIFNSMEKSLPDLYAMRYNKKLSGLVIPTLSEPIPLGVKVSTKNQTFVFSLKESNTDFDVILEDRLTEEQYNLSAGETYQVEGLAVGNCEGRFYLMLQENAEERPGEDVSTEVEDEQSSNGGIDIFTQGNSVVVSASSDIELMQVIVSDMAGRHQVYNVSGQYVELNLPVSTGVYTISVISDKENVVEKIKLN